MAELKLEQRHGKSRVRLARVWRQPEGHLFVEWTISVLLSSDCLPAYTHGDNSSIVATDSIKNTVYALAKDCAEPISIESFALLLGNHFVNTYKQVTGAEVNIVENPWERVTISGVPHQHGFKLGSGKRTAEVSVFKHRQPSVVSGFTDLSLLKTTQSGFEGFVRDKFTLLPEVNERLLASTITARWSYTKTPPSFDKAYGTVIKTLLDTFFGPPSTGVYSPSVQNTLYLMAQDVLNVIPEIESIQLSMPNIHFIPVNMPSIGVKFNHDIYMPTSEPHGSIEATATREGCNTAIFSKL